MRMTGHRPAAGMGAAMLLLVACVAAAAVPPRTGSAQAVAVVTPQRAALSRRLVATGGIHPWQEIIVAPEVGGYQVATMNVDIGDRVRKGQELATLSAGLLQSQVDVGRAGVRQSEAVLANARAALGRGETMSTAGNLSRADLDTLRANAISAEAGLATARANLDAAELRLKYTHVLAPDDGVITARTATIGQVVQAGTEMMRLLRQERVEWRAEVPEADLRLVKAGQAARLVTSEGGAIDGRVRMVAPTVQTGNRTGLVYVDLPPRSGARPGMFARGEIAVGEAQGMTVPLAAVLVADGYSYVFSVGADGVAHRVRVQTGGVHGPLVEVTSGLRGDERLVASGVAFLADGQQVAVQPGGSTP